MRLPGSDNLVILIHGFANPGGRNTTDHFIPGFKSLGCDVVPWDYWDHDGWWSAPFSLVQVRVANEAIANGLRQYTHLARRVYNHIAVIGHSNGGAISWIASRPRTDEQGVEQPGAFFDSVVLINPALDRDAVFGPNTRQIFCIHTPWDVPTRIGGLLPFHWWGDAGARGLDPEPRVVNIDASTNIQFPIRDHDGLMSYKNLEGYWEAEVQRLALCRPQESV